MPRSKDAVSYPGFATRYVTDMPRTCKGRSDEYQYRKSGTKTVTHKAVVPDFDRLDRVVDVDGPLAYQCFEQGYE